MGAIDKVFKAYDIRGLYGSEVDEDLAWKVGHASAQFLRSLLSGYERGQASANRVVVGYDMRPHSKSLVEALIGGVTSSGVACVNIGLCDTPMVYFAVNHLGACGGVQVTASHNPVGYNGFKISGIKARPIGQDTGLREIKHIVSTLRRMPGSAELAECQEVDLWEAYRKHVLKFFKPARKLKVAVDASNGMGGKMVPAIFGACPEVEIIPLNFELGQGFAHPPNPLVEANLQQVKAAIREHQADLGICMDGDADRCMFIDEKAQTVRCDLMTALLARYFLKDNPDSMVVYDLRSSRAVAEEVRDAGGVPKRERVGHSFMKRALSDGHGVFGGELSGHFYFRDNFNCDSGAIAFATACTVISAADKPFSELIAPLNRYSHSGEINFEVEDKAGKMKEIEEKFKDAEIDHLDGVTCQFDDWWCNVRASNTEPLLRLNLEARTDKQMREKIEEIKKILGEPVDH
ncbi:MAG: Phosphomannomutase/phosphoglucomutase [Planctomycetes bacterium ADurb.Bin126]|mgnify:CR=1 FL=1|nr:MAG: Phosphomannomutase/phosphoglucomutase [Planctomycetes bacterium ADurb.Bin126]HOD83282.1 phosphomannomutase/phosphoglucomutase [Phycisphaerae bacterium]HQL73158.1 phosphomannomutase/phosphoglucomutase [Phycisphaerae bacterium]